MVVIGILQSPGYQKSHLKRMLILLDLGYGERSGYWDVWLSKGRFNVDETGTLNRTFVLALAFLDS